MAQPTDSVHFHRETAGGTLPKRTALNVTLWVVQVLLALLFLLAGGMKLALPLEKLSGPVALPGWFVRFIGVVEVLGGAGMILPSLFRIRPSLTAWAGAGIVVVMIGAVGVSLAGGGETAAMAWFPGVIGLLAAFVAYGRWRLVPISPKA